MSQYFYLGTQNLDGKVYGQVDMSGFGWKVKQSDAVSLRTGARKDSPEGSSVKFSVCFGSSTDAASFLAYLWTYNPDHPNFDEAVGANIPLYLRDSSWYYSVWGVVVRPADLNKATMDYLQYAYEVTCYLYSPYSEGASVTIDGTPESLVNTTGHLASSPDVSITCAYSGGHAEDLTVAIADSVSLVLCDVALSSEVWRLIGNENRLLETYTDAIASSTIWDQDTVGDGTFDTDHIELDDDQEAYYLLSGPHPARYPVKMTADLSLDSGGADGLAYVEISADGSSWEVVLDQDDFEAGSAVYYLAGTEFMTDIYVRFSCLSGTSGKKLNIGSIKFEVERWIEAGAVPEVAAAATKNMTVSATNGSLTISGTFRPRRMFV